MGRDGACGMAVGEGYSDDEIEQRAAAIVGGSPEHKWKDGHGCLHAKPRPAVRFRRELV